MQQNVSLDNTIVLSSRVTYWFSITADDFSIDIDQVHTFRSMNTLHQTAGLTIDIVDDTINEQVEQFLAVVSVTRIENEADIHEPEQSEQLFTIITILVDPNAPDSELQLSEYHEMTARASLYYQDSVEIYMHSMLPHTI